MALYAYDAEDYSTGLCVCVLFETEETNEDLRLVQVARAYPNRWGFYERNFLPIWVKEIYPVWYRWQCLHTVGRLDLAPFELVYSNRWARGQLVTLSVPLLQGVFDPYKLARWLWGCRPFTVQDVKTFGVTETIVHAYHGTDWHDEAARIRYLMDVGWNDPIEVCTDYRIVGRDIMVEEGNHRFAAAIARGDKTIAALAIGDMDIIRRYIPNPDI
jgi:hypothetical protein